MKKSLLILLISLLLPIYSFSQTTWTPKLVNDSLIVISSQQLKATNLIFLEHKKLITINNELTEQVNNYKYLYNNVLEIQAINDSIIVDLKDNLLLLNKQLSTTNKQRNKLKLITIGSITITGVLAIWILLQ